MHRQFVVTYSIEAMAHKALQAEGLVFQIWFLKNHEMCEASIGTHAPQ